MCTLLYSWCYVTSGKYVQFQQANQMYFYCTKALYTKMLSTDNVWMPLVKLFLLFYELVQTYMVIYYQIEHFQSLS